MKTLDLIDVPDKDGIREALQQHYQFMQAQAAQNQPQQLDEVSKAQVELAANNAKEMGQTAANIIEHVATHETTPPQVALAMAEAAKQDSQPQTPGVPQ